MQMKDRIRSQFADQIGDGEVGIKEAKIDTPVVDRTQRLVKGLVTTTDADMDDEVVLPNFVTSYFPENVKAVYLDHQYVLDGRVAAVGVCRSLAVKSSGAYALTYVMESGLGDDILSAIEAGALQGMSIGFQVLESGPPDADEKAQYGVDVKSVVRRSKLLEYSFTSMPANPGALVQLDSLVTDGTIRRKSAVLMGLPDSPERKSWPVREPRARRELVVGEGVYAVREVA